MAVLCSSADGVVPSVLDACVNVVCLHGMLGLLDAWILSGSMWECPRLSVDPVLPVAMCTEHARSFSSTQHFVGLITANHHRNQEAWASEGRPK